MRIISLYISNFGKLNNFKLNFENGLNTLIKENGFGKTTLAVFIKCMFYGIKGGNKGGLTDENERIKYYTWESNKLIGGTLDFEFENTTYHIERYFGDKPSGDTFKITNLKTNKPADNFTSNLGEEIFGVDVNGFERSTYLPQKLVDFKRDSDTLSTKLVSLTYDTDNINSVDDIIKNLETESKKYYKLSGKSGLIAETKNNITNLEIKINECVTFENNAMLIQEDINKLENTIKSLNENLNKLSPELERALTSNSLLEEYNKLLNKIENTNIRLSELKTFFNNQEINVENLNSLIELAQELVKLENQIEILTSNVSNSKLKEYTAKFNNQTPDLQEIDKYIELCDNISTNLSSKPNNDANDLKSKNLFKNPLIWFYTLLSIGFGLLIASVVCFFINIYLGFSLFAGSLVLTLLSFVFKNMKKTNSKTKLSDNDRIILNSINEYLSSYKYDNSNPKQALYSLRSDVLVYLNLISSENDTYEKLDDLKNKQKEIYNTCTNYLSNFYDNINTHPLELLIDVKNNYLEFEGLNIKLKEFEKDLKVLSKKVDTNLDFNSLKLEQEKLVTGIELYQTEKQKLINSKNSMLERCNLKQDYIQQLAQEKENFKMYFNKYNVITSTIAYLKQAKENMCSKYLEPLTKNFVKHLNKITGNEIKDVCVDADFNISVLDNTISRNIEYFSKGYKDLINICLRFALIDTLFLKTKPFIILDDPFINLDDEKFKSMVGVIENLSKDYQIIYLTCHTSRG